jgi:hypothetical protein
MSVPEPPPLPHGLVIPDRLISLLQDLQRAEIEGSVEHKQQTAFYLAELEQLIRDRDAFGRAKYGQPLMSEDGRNGVEDCKQEIGDMLQYFLKTALTAPKEQVEYLYNLIVTAKAVITYIQKQEN